MLILLHSFDLSILSQLYIHYFTDASLIVNGYCQSISPPSSSSNASITSTQSVPTNSTQSVPTNSTRSVPTNSTRSVPTHLTQSFTTNSTQKNINEKTNINIANTTPKEYSFVRTFLISFDL